MSKPNYSYRHLGLWQKLKTGFVRFSNKQDSGEPSKFTPVDFNMAGTKYENVVTSKMKERWPDDDEDRHLPVLDIDLPIHVIPSSTPEHYHLYIEHSMSWRQYQLLLWALWQCHIIEEGYYKASISRGYTTLRLPWVHKGDVQCEPPVDEPKEKPEIKGDQARATFYDEVLKRTRSINTNGMGLFQIQHPSPSPGYHQGGWIPWIPPIDTSPPPCPDKDNDDDGDMTKEQP